MPMPELPINVDDPSFDTQRDGVRENGRQYQTGRGKKRDSDNQPHQHVPDAPIRYKEQP